MFSFKVDSEFVSERLIPPGMKEPKWLLVLVELSEDDLFLVPELEWIYNYVMIL